MTEQEFLGAMLAAGIAASGHVCAHGVQLDIGIELGDGHVEVCEFLVDVKTRRMCEGLEHDDWRVVDLGRHSVVAVGLACVEGLDADVMPTRARPNLSG